MKEFLFTLCALFVSIAMASVVAGASGVGFDYHVIRAVWAIALGVLIVQQFVFWFNKLTTKRLADLEKYPYPTAKEKREAEISTIEMHRRARDILKDRPKRFVGGTDQPVRHSPPPMRPLSPEDHYLDHPQIKRVPPRKPVLVESPRKPDTTTDLNILIGMGAFGEIADNTPTSTPAPEYKGSGGDAGGAGSSAMWTPDPAPSPSPQAEANTSADTSSGFDHSSGGHHD